MTFSPLVIRLVRRLLDFLEHGLVIRQGTIQDYPKIWTESVLNFTGKIKPLGLHFTYIIERLYSQAHSLRDNRSFIQHVLTNLLVDIHGRLEQAVEERGLKTKIYLLGNLPRDIFIRVT